MWICDGDRASGILLSFEEEITAREWRRFIGSIGCRFKKELFHIEFKPQKLSLLCESLMKSTSCLWNTLMSRRRRQRSQFQTLHYMLVAWKVFHTFKQSLKRPNVQPIKCQMFKLMLLFIGHHNWTWEKTPKIIYWIGGEFAALPLVTQLGNSKQQQKTLVWCPNLTSTYPRVDDCLE